VVEGRLAHGYTNQSWLAGELVVKQYQGVDAAVRLGVEVEALARVAGVVPVPGSTSKAAGPVGRTLRDAVLPIVFRQLSKNDSAATRWITNHHIDWHTDYGTAASVP
jgi:hypothetical protein